ncbi:hypothetical protein AB0B57_17830 [Micromonospora sp. NPDC049101]|uniref:hypothetical protein n=1 Tax=unclassified Micromonospora TaxID=2617518 RepID=UPI0033D820E2
MLDPKRQRDMEEWRRDAAGVPFSDVVKFFLLIVICCPLPVVLLNSLNDGWDRSRGTRTTDTGPAADAGPGADAGPAADAGPGAEDVARWYLDAALTNHDPSATSEMTCDSPQLGVVDQWREEVARREAALGLQLVTDAVDVEVQSESTDSATVSVVIEVSAEQQRLRRTFELYLVRAGDEWRACGATAN